MTDDDRNGFERTVGRKAARRIRARRERDNVWFWLGMLGLVGWSVAIPTVLGVALGLWLDRVQPVGFSWTISMMIVGLTIGLLNAWYWISHESAAEEDRLQEEEDS